MPSRGWDSGLAETYSSYLSVASALYALIPVLTLFLMTQSIHPMMNAVKGVTPMRRWILVM